MNCTGPTCVEMLSRKDSNTMDFPNTTNAIEEDPTAAFLALERAVLGEDAAQFGNEATLSTVSSVPQSVAPAFQSPVFDSGLNNSAQFIQSSIAPAVTGGTDFGWGSPSLSTQTPYNTVVSPNLMSSTLLTPAARIGFTNTGISNSSSMFSPPEPEPESI
ncbi:hypothetical protein HK096_010096, partial [Nowakowskiella sp. JEL0078]